MIKREKMLMAALAALFFMVSLTGFAETKPVAEVMVGSSGITWQPLVGFERLVLTVSTPEGKVIRKAFRAGATPYFDLSDLQGASLLDGSYTYELRVIPFIGKKVRKEGADTAANLQTTPPGEALVQSGHFRVAGGSIVTPSGPEEGISKPLDQVILDDLIVDGSACIGFDCVNGESFGFDTLRLKENNLRIHFQDTSTSASFPTNDWRIVINDSSNGGASYVAVEDSDAGRSVFKIEAGTRANALYVDDSGRVGLGTATPAEDLHIWYGDTPTVRLHQSGSGWAPQTWDVAGNEANFFIRDVTNGSKLPLRIQPSTPSSTLCLKSDGKVGIGTWSPSAQLEIEETGAVAKLLLDRTDGATAVLEAQSTRATFGTESNHDLILKTNGATRMTIAAGGNVGIGITPTANLLHLNGGAYSDGSDWYPASSIEYKENINALGADEAVAALNDLNPVKYNYKDNKTDERVGFIAEEVPELVATNTRKALSPMDIVAVLTKVVKEQQKMVQEQQKTISELKREINELKKK